MFFKRLFSAIPAEREILRKKMKYIATKRGIVENEIIFERFIESSFDQLSDSDINLFNDFLQEYDWDIFAWISGQRNVPTKYEKSNLFKVLKENIYPAVLPTIKNKK